MSFSPYFVCALLGVASLQGGLAEGNRIWVLGPVGGGGGGSSLGIGTQPANAVFQPGQLKNRSFRNLLFFFLILSPLKMTIQGI